MGKSSATFYRAEVSVYYSFGSVYSTHIEAKNKRELKKKMNDFLAEYKKKEDAEVVSFYGVRKTTISAIADMKDKLVKLTKKVTNPYIKHQYK